MSHIELPHPPESAIAELHRTIVATAQQYVDGANPRLIHHSLREYVGDYRGHLLQKSTRDQAFEKIQLLRILREAPLAALGRIIGDEIIRRVLTYSNGERLDANQMMGGGTAIYAYTFGMVNSLEEMVDTAIIEMTNPNHPYYELLRLYCTIDTEFLPIMDSFAKRIGTTRKSVTETPYDVLLVMFTSNYHVGVGSLLTLHGITIQDRYGELPDAATLVASTMEERPHWLALASVPRIQHERLVYGPSRYRLILEGAQATGTVPTWSGFWLEGLICAVNGLVEPFSRCPMRSPLLHRRPGDVIVAGTSPGASRCAGQIALSSTPEANNRAERLFSLLGREPAQGGKFSPAELIVDLGRYLSRGIFADQACRAALVRARLARDQVAATMSQTEATT